MPPRSLLAQIPTLLSHLLLLQLLFAPLGVPVLNVVSADICECKWLGTSYLVTRLWNIVSPDWSDQSVIDEFNDGFSPIVTYLPGFQVYTSAATGNSSTVFFMNIFDSQETAKAAQEGAKKFIEDGALSGAITPNQFTETYLSFHFTAGNCVRESIEGKYLSTRLWKLTPDSNFTIDGVALEFEAFYKPIIQQEPGFLEYGGATVTSTDYIFFFNVFETPEGAAAANEGAARFMREGRLLGNIEKVVFTEGIIGFDYSCATTEQEKDDQTSGGSSLCAGLRWGNMLGLAPPFLLLAYQILLIRLETI